MGFGNLQVFNVIIRLILRKLEVSEPVVQQESGQELRVSCTSGFRMRGVGSRVQGSGFRVWGFGSRKLGQGSPGIEP